MDNDLQETLDLAASISEAAAKSLRNPNQSLDDLDDLEKTMRHVANTIRSIRNTQYFRKFKK